MKWFIVFFFCAFVFVCNSLTVAAGFVCDDFLGGSSCNPISGVSCDSIIPDQVNSCTGTTGSYWNVASCDSFDHTDGSLNYFKRYYFRIRKNSTSGICGSTSWSYSHTWSQTGATNTNVLPSSCTSYAGGGLPTGCGQGSQPAGPTPTPPGGGGGSCPPGSWSGPPINCAIVPCAYKNQCGCTCTQPPCSAMECTGGPPPTATPTPTPTPFCHVFCPGQESMMGLLNGTGGGVPNLDYQPTPILPTQASGFLQYKGYNNFVCGTFDDAKTYPKVCPASAGGSIGNQSSYWTYPTPTTNPLRYNMLCGNNTHVYTAIVNAGERTGIYGGNGGIIGGPTATTGPTPKLGLYPPGCSIATPTPTVSGGYPNVYDQDAGFLKSQGGTIGSDSNSCSCSVAVGCQTSLQALPSALGEGCGATCDFTVSPETPEFGDATTFTPSGSGVDGSASFSFDDNSPVVGAGNGAVTHTFANSGVYRVALACPSVSATCTRTLNNYCGPLSWFKIKDASFHKNNSLNDPIPTGVAAYDGDDTTQSLVSIGNPGLVTTNGSITTGAGNLSTPNWRTTIYTPNGTYTPVAFADYLIARKTYSTITDANNNGVIDSNELADNTTNYIVGNFTIDSNSIQSKAPLVLVVRGNITLDIQNNNEFNPPDKAVTIIATGTLKIDDHMDTLNGIFIATNVDLANGVASTTTPLKVVGNLISQNSVDLKKRIRTDGSKPSLFVVQNYKQYLRVLDKLGIRKYTQTELRP